MLRELRKGNPEAKITILIATGCHRDTTKEELIDKFGEEIVAQEHIVVHDCSDTENLVTIGTLPSGGELQINLQAQTATLAVWESDDREGTNALGFSHPVDGYSHEDCIPFSGDCTAWTPTFRNGKTLSELAGKTLLFEVCFTDGTLWSLEGDFTNVHNTQAARYRMLGLLPQEWT